MNMSPYFLFSLLFFPFTKSFGQSFEGTLTYKVEHDLKPQEFGNVMMNSQEIIKRMKSNGDYYDQVVVKIKGGNYKKAENSNIQKKFVYRTDSNNIYTFQRDMEYIVIIDGNKVDAFGTSKSRPVIEQIDTSVKFNGIDCKLVKLTWKNNHEISYYYNPDMLKVDPTLFQNHRYEYLNQILDITKAYPIAIINKISPNTTIKTILTSQVPEKIDDKVFFIPKLVDAESDYADMMLQLTGMVVKKVKK